MKIQLAFNLVAGVVLIAICSQSLVDCGINPLTALSNMFVPAFERIEKLLLEDEKPKSKEEAIRKVKQIYAEPKIDNRLKLHLVQLMEISLLDEEGNICTKANIATLAKIFKAAKIKMSDISGDNSNSKQSYINSVLYEYAAKLSNSCVEKFEQEFKLGESNVSPVDLEIVKKFSEDCIKFNEKNYKLALERLDYSKLTCLANPEAINKFDSAKLFACHSYLRKTEDFASDLEYFQFKFGKLWSEGEGEAMRVVWANRAHCDSLDNLIDIW